MANGWESVVDEVVALQVTPGDWKPGPAMQWFPKQWLGDDVVMMMSLPIRGYHHHLIQMAWQQDPPCSLPDDVLALSGWCGDPEDWDKVWSRASRAWKLRNGRWWQIGLCRAYLEQMRLRVVRKGTGKLGGRPKVIREEPIASESEPIGSSDEAIGCLRTTSSSASSSAPALSDPSLLFGSTVMGLSLPDSDSDATARVPRPVPVEVPVPPSLATPIFLAVWGEFRDWRSKQKHKRMTEKAEKLTLAGLEPYGTTVAVEALQASMRNDWTGVFPEKVAVAGSRSAVRNVAAIGPDWDIGRKERIDQANRDAAAWLKSQGIVDAES